ncbi:MAG TPA: DnaJ domain-containing protein [Candidatus Onthousia faecigallinarum]|nr:DnaJ domain-containing protein [Candidatus Onthousia faecigallinarum]
MDNYYGILGVSRNASQEEIKKAFYQMARKYHPDNNPSQDTTEMMQRITLAYQTLSDESKKVVYDRVYDFKFRQQRGSFFSQTDYSQNTTKNKTGEENFWEFYQEFFNARKYQQDVWEERRKKHQQDWEEQLKRYEREREERQKQYQREREERQKQWEERQKQYQRDSNTKWKIFFGEKDCVKNSNNEEDKSNFKKALQKVLKKSKRY